MNFNEFIVRVTNLLGQWISESTAWFINQTAVDIILTVVLFITLLILFIIGMIFITRFITWRNRKIRYRITELLNDYIMGNRKVEKTPFIRRHRMDFFHELVRLKETMELPLELTEEITRLLLALKIDKKLLKKLRSWNHDRKVKATILLSHLPIPKLFETLAAVFQQEKRYHMKVYLAYALGKLREPGAIPVIIESLPDAPEWYCKRIYGILTTFSTELLPFLEDHVMSEIKEIRSLVMYGAMKISSPMLNEALLAFARSSDSDLAYEAVKSLKPLYYLDLDNSYFLNHENPLIRREAVQALSRHNTPEYLLACLPYLEDPETKGDAIYAMSSILQKTPRLFYLLIDTFLAENNIERMKGIAEVLSNRIEYLLLKLKNDEDGRYRKIVYMLLVFGYITGIISFINKNNDSEIKEKILSLLKSVLEERPDLKKELSQSLDKKYLDVLGIAVVDVEQVPPRSEKVRRRYLFLFLMAGLGLFPVLFIINFWDDLGTITIDNIFYRYLFIFNYYFAFYSIALNSIYLMLMVLSLREKRKQKRRWQSKYLSMLFAPEILPSISIIAPAYGEEETILQSVSSLLNLRYPEYEVIVVNDGSKDDTLQILIQHFGLERTDFLVDQVLQTSPVRGFYFNKDYPRLKVIDKVNGGKADSLNAGINLASCEYFCGIDADSLLEDDALLKIASTFLDAEHPVIAAGGNIVPVNGCDINHGEITRVGVPKNFLARLQTLEYFRSFLSGRLGWSSLNLLLIISGAFGVFKKDAVIQARGYLTSKELYGKDTVGEDMELVVRLSRQQKEMKNPVVIHYAYNANCWTEVPETWNMLYKQRDRWHRGLMDIITFHITMMFNPRYGRIGLAALPYFLIFEVIGPWIELQGYIIFFASLALGLLNSATILLLFGATMVYGMLLSVLSIYIVETGIGIFRFRDLMKILLFALWENFGLRQILSMMRISGFINSLKQKSGWGTMVRKGFTSHSDEKA
jgi:peptidoglycan-N-acetylglucosamine deacetylase